FVFGKRLSSRVLLVYAQSLQDPESRFIKLEAEPGHNATLTVLRKDDGSFSYGAGQRLRRGGPASPVATDERVSISEVRLEGERPLEPAELEAALRTRPGQRRTIWNLQDAAERLRKG